MAREAYPILERRACRIIGISRSTVGYRIYTPFRNCLLKELAAVRGSAW